MTQDQIQTYIKVNHVKADCEAKVQRKVVSFLERFKATNDLDYHYNNNNLTSHSKNKAENKRRGAYNRRLGVKAGIPDLEVMCPQGVNLYWELKAVNGSLSSGQEEVIKNLRRLEHQVLVTYGLRESIECFLDWYWLIGG